ncbi:hypothetical protein [Ancylomarina sp. 16SWW S1-10-2]|uniref:hypothetical protein n=1 Tax=Ancylomarina sp. 16SWW S1-10-2 TaxID=2499681 RepID=UPI0012AE20B6|nr:hypothetical protein [Ancylomarina sp. 16SWW S1-10-2]MRT94880.1 hypothetical protein [Ancylomarina sp. 16SWW S1-10-2]
MDYTNIPTDRRNLERLIVTYHEYTQKFIHVETGEDLQPKNHTYYVKDGKTIDHFDLNFMRFNLTSFRPTNINVGWGLLVFGLFILLIGGQFLVACIILFVPSIYFFIIGYTLPKHKYIIFHRDKGILELPGAFYDKPHHIPFDDVPAFFAPNGAAALFYWSLKVKRTNKVGIKDFFPISLNFFMSPGWDGWSYWVWYMDRNRPLPPGVGLDEFRAADFERRKAEGFPAPLYKSRIETPEATPEQQVEREKYWKDIDFMMS